MRLDDLENLKLCLDTGDVNFFHGDLAEAFKEVVDELHDKRQKYEDSLSYKEDFEDAQLAIQEMLEEKTNIMVAYEKRKQVTVIEMDEHFDTLTEIVARVLWLSVP